MTYKDITIIILLFNTPNKFLINLKNYKNFKIVILDQSNDFETKKKIKKILPNILYYKITKTNYGFAKAINFLSKKVKTKFFLCTQPDVKIDLKSILNLKKIFNKKKDCIISLPKITTYKNYKFTNKRQKIIPVKNMIGAIFLTKKKLFNQINKFDEDFFFYWEDVDLSRRIRNSKFKLYINKDSKAAHFAGQSTSKTFKDKFIKNVNFKFGEYLYQYKYSELKLIKIFREPITKFLLIFFYLFTFQFKKSNMNFFHFIGIIKFFIYHLKNINLK
tara:strand:- start:2270 stop:3094 length:825 start_codon:yes stop_codon:yes gene_type:complete